MEVRNVEHEYTIEIVAKADGEVISKDVVGRTSDVESLAWMLNELKSDGAMTLPEPGDVRERNTLEREGEI